MRKTIIPALEEFEGRFRNLIAIVPGPVAILAGHYSVDKNGKDLVEEDDPFGIFPQYTFDMGLQLVKLATSIVIKDAKILVLVDDHSLTGRPFWYIEDSDEARQISLTLENKFTPYQLPEQFREQLDRRGLSEEDILRTSEGSLAFRESFYRTIFHDEQGLTPGCAGEYRVLLEDLARQGIRSLLGFIPLRCQGPTCNAAGQYGFRENPRLRLDHVYLATGEDIQTKEGLETKTIEVFGGIPLYSTRVGGR